jgi:DNA-binding PadR family transcriptional regulator
MAQAAHDRLVQRRPLLPACLLLLLAESPSHGYELAERLKQWGFELTGPGPVYRELRVLEEHGLVRSAWSPSGSGPVPRVYEVTPVGRKALDRAAVDLEGIQQLLREFQQRHGSLAGSSSSRRRKDR